MRPPRRLVRAAHQAEVCYLLWSALQIGRRLHALVKSARQAAERQQRRCHLLNDDGKLARGADAAAVAGDTLRCVALVDAFCQSVCSVPPPRAALSNLNRQDRFLALRVGAQPERLLHDRALPACLVDRLPSRAYHRVLLHIRNPAACNRKSLSLGPVDAS